MITEMATLNKLIEFTPNNDNLIIEGVTAKLSLVTHARA